MTVPAMEPSDPIDAFVQRYAMFRLELDLVEMEWFDWLVDRVRGYRRSIARGPQPDFERPILLAMVVEASKYQDEARRELAALARRLDEVIRVLVDGDVVRERPAPPTVEELDRAGQTRLPSEDPRQR